MPCYYVDTFNSIVVHDDVGHDVADLPALRKLVRQSLAAMMRDEKDGRHSVQLRADVRDDTGHMVMTASLLMVIEEIAR